MFALCKKRSRIHRIHRTPCAVCAADMPVGAGRVSASSSKSRPAPSQQNRKSAGITQKGDTKGQDSQTSDSESSSKRFSSLKSAWGSLTNSKVEDSVNSARPAGGREGQDDGQSIPRTKNAGSSVDWGPDVDEKVQAGNEQGEGAGRRLQPSRDRARGRGASI